MNRDWSFDAASAGTEKNGSVSTGSGRLGVPRPSLGHSRRRSLGSIGSIFSRPNESSIFSNRNGSSTSVAGSTDSRLTVPFQETGRTRRNSLMSLLVSCAGSMPLGNRAVSEISFVFLMGRHWGASIQNERGRDRSRSRRSRGRRRNDPSPPGMGQGFWRL